ncbi:MAG TPA: methyltransferase type 11 [Rhodospirillaceae bacterium]|nr:methyltransferase type 11 [Rhodospirillaceae bacterium]HAA92237.1 methyltransferase type 11 [Rhodospirillaceae bacterium]HAT35374.1 methyltransferase type 11 [Rhodospirillaceae bacterium]
MYNDVIDLRDFYASRLGQVGRRLIRGRVRSLWPNVQGMTVLGLGYATPYLRSFKNEAEAVLAAMPAPQGVVHWPEQAPGRVALADDRELPFPDRSIDRLLIVHGLECSENLRAMLREAWRVMADGGRMITIVPNRRGLWSRFEQRSPFGHGHPYSVTQLRRLLRDGLFTPIQSEHALYLPPSRSRLIMRSAPAIEKIGHRWFQAVSGVLLVEASKQIYAGTTVTEGKAVRSRRLVALPGGNAASHSRSRNMER